MGSSQQNEKRNDFHTVGLHCSVCIWAKLAENLSEFFTPSLNILNGDVYPLPNAGRPIHLQKRSKKTGPISLIKMEQCFQDGLSMMFPPFFPGIQPSFYWEGDVGTAEIYQFQPRPSGVPGDRRGPNPKSPARRKTGHYPARSRHLKIVAFDVFFWDVSWCTI